MISRRKVGGSVNSRKAASRLAWARWEFGVELAIYSRRHTSGGLLPPWADACGPSPVLVFIVSVRSAFFVAWAGL